MKPPEPTREELHRETVKAGKGWTLEKAVIRTGSGSETVHQTFFEIKGKATSEALTAKIKATIRSAGEPPVLTGKAAEGTRNILKQIEAAAEGKCNRRAAKAAHIAHGYLNTARDTSKGTDKRLEAAFRAGQWYFKAMAAFRDADALHGKRMDPSRAAKRKGGTRRSQDPLRLRIADCWEDYKREAGAGATRTDFVKWLRGEAKDFGITWDSRDGLFSMGDSERKPDTIRRWPELK